MSSEVWCFCTWSDLHFETVFGPSLLCIEKLLGASRTNEKSGTRGNAAMQLPRFRFCLVNGTSDQTELVYSPPVHSCLTCNVLSFSRVVKICDRLEGMCFSACRETRLCVAQDIEQQSLIKLEPSEFERLSGLIISRYFCAPSSCL